jgi:hypothetical protein
MLVLFAALVCSCGGSLYKVKPVSKLPPMPSTAATAKAGSLEFRADPVLTDEETQELFESNLQLAGLLPVRMEINYAGSETIEIRKLKFQLRDGAGTEFKPISAKKAISRILKANGVSAYNPESRKTFEREFRAYELDLKTPLTQAEVRKGFLIFQTPAKEPVSSPHGLVLTVSGLAQPVVLNLN